MSVMNSALPRASNRQIPDAKETNMTRAGSSTLSSPQIPTSAAPLVGHDAAREPRRQAGSVKSWAAMLLRVITSGVLRADLRRSPHHAGFTRSDIETLALMYRTFGKRHG
jgi:hypothetical protein